MKLPTLTTIFGLTSLFTSFTTATITIKDLPPTLKSRSWYDVTYSSDRDYEIRDFLVMSWGIGGKPSGQIINHFIHKPAGEMSAPWKVPALKDGDYWLFISAYESLTDVNGYPLPDYNESRIAYHNSNTFEIYGGPKLYQRELVWVMFGTFCALVLLIGIWVVGVRVWRKRRGAAVDVSEGDEGNYRDEVTGT